MAHDIFISYSNKDKAIADAICAKLEERKIRCWIAPRDVPPGANFAGSIVDAIDNCKLFILIWSSNTNQSEHILNELNQAFDDGTQVVPFRIENVEPTKSLKYYIGRTHWLDAMTPPLETHIKTLGDVILTNLGRKAEIKPIVPVNEKKEEPKEESKEKTKIAVSRPNIKPRNSWPYVIGLIGLLAIAGILFIALRQPSSPAMEPSSAASANSTQQIPTLQEATAVPTSSPPTQEPTAIIIQQTNELQVTNTTQDLGSPYYQTGFTKAAFDAKDWPVREAKGQNLFRGEDDTYQFDIQPPTEYGIALYRDGSKVFTNSIVEVDAKFVEGDGEMGIICRADYAQSHGYSLKGIMASFNKNGRTTIYLVHTGKPPLLTIDGPIMENGINYRLRFDCIGQKLTVYENGVKIGETQDNTIYVGSLGLFTTNNVNVAFDNFKLWLPKYHPE